MRDVRVLLNEFRAKAPSTQSNAKNSLRHFACLASLRETLRAFRGGRPQPKIETVTPCPAVAKRCPQAASNSPEIAVCAAGIGFALGTPDHPMRIVRRLQT